MSSQLKTCVSEIGISFSRCTIEKLPPVVGVSVKKNMFIEVKFENGDDPKHSGGLIFALRLSQPEICGFDREISLTSQKIKQALPVRHLSFYFLRELVP